MSARGDEEVAQAAFAEVGINTLRDIFGATLGVGHGMTTSFRVRLTPGFLLLASLPD